MQDPTHRYLLYRGETLLGVVVHTEDDQPFHVGYIEPSSGFADVALMFEEMANLSQASGPLNYHNQNLLQELRDRIARPGLRMVGESTGQLRFEPQIFTTDGKMFRWRGHVWHEGRRI